MDSMNISLPHTLRAYIDGQVAEGRFATASEYVRDLIRADEKLKAQRKLEVLLHEGLASEELAWTENSMDEIRQMARMSN
jgi:antitoxin ParD1/3/4